MANTRKAGGESTGDKPKRIRRRPPTCTTRDKRAVDKFINRLLRGAVKNEREWGIARKANATAMVVGSHDYWKAAVKCLRWCKQVNLQRRTKHVKGDTDRTA